MKALRIPFCFHPDPIGGTEAYVASLAREQLEQRLDSPGHCGPVLRRGGLRTTVFHSTGPFHHPQPPEAAGTIAAAGSRAAMEFQITFFKFTHRNLWRGIHHETDSWAWCSPCSRSGDTPTPPRASRRAGQAGRGASSGRIRAPRAGTVRPSGAPPGPTHRVVPRTKPRHPAVGRAPASVARPAARLGACGVNGFLNRAPTWFDNPVPARVLQAPTYPPANLMKRPCPPEAEIDMAGSPFPVRPQ